MGLGKNEQLHLICEYENNKDKCPKKCSKCAISIKKEADHALESNHVEDAIKQYKKSLFADSKYAEAWCCLGNAYRMKFEYNNALSAFNKALSIDSQYGYAMFRKAVTLRDLGNLDAAMSLTNDILELYDDPNVRDFKAELIRIGIRDTKGVYTLQKAIDTLTDKAYEIITNNNLFDADGKIHSIPVVYRKEDFSDKILTFCKRRYNSLGNEKVWSESILAAFYGSAYVALKYFQSPEEFNSVDPFEYLINNVNLEEIDRSAEKLLGIRGDDNQSEKIWNIIYPLVTAATPILSKIEPSSDLNPAMQDVTEDAYVIGMQLAKWHYKQEEKKSIKPSLNEALKKLADSAKDYVYTPEPRGKVALKVVESVPLYFRCDKCGQRTSIEVFYDNVDTIIDKYNALAGKFTQLGYPTTVKCVCNQCADKYYPTNDYLVKNNFVFSVTRPDYDKPIDSFPQTNQYSDSGYRIALAFLEGANTLTKLSETTHTKYSPEGYLGCIHRVLGDIIDKS